MTEGGARGAPGERALPILAALVALLPDLGAAVPGLTYWFRDFTVTFYPMRAFAARELAAGRLPWWNPYVDEGTFVLPMLYPPELLHAVVPGPAFASWLLTLHLPLAALTAYALARTLGASRGGAFVTGAVFSVGGLAVSSLNLYVFLQALALAPLVALSLRRAVTRGGPWIAVAAGVLGLSLTTLAVEFVAQGVLLGLALGWADRPQASSAGRQAAACLLGLGLAAVPLLTLSAVLPETVRGAGFDREVALGNELHPVALAQALVPRLFGDPAAPVEAWWGARFFTKGFPYFLTLYVGPLTLALAAAGVGAIPRRRRIALLAVACLGLWYALGARGGLASAAAAVAPLSSFRFPSKAILLPFLAVAVLAGAGLDRLRAGAGWRPFALAAAPACLAGVAIAAFAPGLGDWLAGAAPPTVPRGAITRALAADGLRLAGLAGGALALALAVRRGVFAHGAASAVLAAALCADLMTAARGVNPQAPPAFFAPLPEMAALRLQDLGGGRVFTYGLDESPAYRSLLARSAGARALWSFFLSRQTLAPYANVLDAVELADGKDLTGFVRHSPRVSPGDLAPERVGEILPRLREAAVARVVSLDPLEHPELSEVARVPGGPPAVQIHVYAVRDPWPRVYLECGAAGVCASGGVRREGTPGHVVLAVSRAPAGSRVVLRDNHAKGWKARVDGREAVLEHAGRHVAVRVGEGDHTITLTYRPPRLTAAVALTALALALTVLVAVRGTR